MSDVVVVGSYVQDLAFQTSVFPAPGETRIGEFRTGPGGKGFNQAVAAHRLGVDTLFVGAVGTDVFADALRDFLDTEVLDARLQIVPGASSGAASIVVDATAQNLIVVSLGANNALSEAHVEAQANLIGGACALVCQVECNLGATRRSLQLARDAGVTTILNPAPINDGLDADLLALADILVPNETEFAFLMDRLFGVKLAGEYWLDPGDPLHAICRKAGVETVLLTLGDKGAFVSTAHGYFSVPAAGVSPVDTTGAGDAFTGGLAAGLVQFADDLERAVVYANLVAGLSTEKPGTAEAMPSRADVDARGAG